VGPPDEVVSASPNASSVNCDAPVLDIKPYVPTFDAVAAQRIGWLEQAAERVHRVRGRPPLR
jgi:hypothetical protein